MGEILGALATGMTEADVIAEFPQLTHEDLLACFAFAAERDCRLQVIPAASWTFGDTPRQAQPNVWRP